ncbi:hypothetical protein SLEP1_g47474 [Rubroshorea leprosula]|uniref:Uncharacterized protein n=1 Tax=Rubroshorea leprosula TaxID=152421 RepID=A0AAV5LQR4_9ROSI|nr:hypothetical protein SLEP1_g47474 [Rubroshorea leprosula]
MTLPTSCLAQASALGKSSFLTKKSSSLGYMKGVPRGFGLKSTHFKASAMAVYNLKLIGPNGEENEFEAPDDTYILVQFYSIVPKQNLANVKDIMH